MPELKYLDLRGNKLELIGKLSGMSKLEDLILKDNNIKGLPDFSAMNRLETLDISDNALNILPKLRSRSLLFIDASGNHLTDAPDFSGCTALKDINLLNQTYKCKAVLKSGSSYVVDPVPEIITYYGDHGSAAITNRKGKTVFKAEFSELKHSGYRIDTSGMGKGEYTLVITGYKGEAVLGRYTYYLVLEGKSSIHITMVIAAAFVLITLGAAVIFLKRNKGRSNSNE